MERGYWKSSVSLWKILEFWFCFLLLMPMKRLRILRPCEKLVPSLHVRDETIKRSSCFITEYNIYHVEERTWSPLAIFVIVLQHVEKFLKCWIVSFDAYKWWCLPPLLPLQWHSFSRKNQKLSNHYSRILETIYFHSFDVLMLIFYIQLFCRWIYDDTGL